MYKHNLLFAKGRGGVQKTYRIPRQIEEHIARLAREQDATNTDVVIDALLHYFSPEIADDLTVQIERVSREIEKNGAREHNGRQLLKQYRRLELLRMEFIDYFIETLGTRLHGLMASEANPAEGRVDEVLGERDQERATLKALLERARE